MLDYINTNFKKHIITIEDPVEFEIVSKKSLVNQREI
jgi:twitching motility protein PilT